MSETVKTFDAKLFKATKLLEEFSLETENKVNVSKVIQIKEILSTIETPQPKCASCVYVINKASILKKPYDCELKMMPKKIKIDESGVFNYGCIFHSDF